MISHLRGIQKRSDAGWLRGEESVCQCGRCVRLGFAPWLGKIAWRRKRQLIPVLFLGNPTERGWRAAVHDGELGVTERLTRRSRAGWRVMGWRGGAGAGWPQCRTGEPSLLTRRSQAGRELAVRRGLGLPGRRLLRYKVISGGMWAGVGGDSGFWGGRGHSEGEGSEPCGSLAPTYSPGG